MRQKEGKRKNFLSYDIAKGVKGKRKRKRKEMTRSKGK